MYESRKIGIGAFGTVHLGENKLTKEMVAIKKMDLALMRSRGVDIEKVKEEAKIQNKFNHENIVKCYGWFLSSDKKSLFIILEYCTGGTLKDLINESDTIGP